MIVETQTSDLEQEKALTRTAAATNQLITDPGTPENWEKNNFQKPGLAEKPGVLNATKIKRLEGLDKSDLQKGLKTAGIRIEIEWGTNRTVTGSEVPEEGSANAFTRQVMVDDGKTSRPGNITVITWR